MRRAQDLASEIKGWTSSTASWLPDLAQPFSVQVPRRDANDSCFSDLGNFPENGCTLALKGFPGGRGYETEGGEEATLPSRLRYLSHLENPFPPMSQTTTSHFQVGFNSGLPETGPHPNRNRLCCQGHPLHRMGEEQSVTA